ncbi:MAG: dipeptidyl carboxypeptidase II, partial [Candidatus Neomarinimicrobiota bacterium]
MKFKSTTCGIFTLFISLFFGGCFPGASNSLEKKSETVNSITQMKPNPFFQESKLYMNYPPFDKIKNSHYIPAFNKGMAEQIEEIELIANSIQDPSFENTIVAIEKTGQMLERVSRVFFALTSAHTNDSLETIRSEMAPKLSAHGDQILLNGKLFSRVETLYKKRENLNLNAEGLRLVEETYKRFIRAGAKLSAMDKELLKEINSKLAVHQTTFSQNVLNEVNDLAVIIDSREDLEGFSESMIETTMKEAESRKLAGKYIITLQNTSGQPPLSLLKNRKLRERIYKASLSRGNRGGEFDNKRTFISVIKLRAERAQLMGYDNHASYV